MNHDYIEQNHIIDRYLKGGLTDSEADLFADHSIGCHQCIHQLELAERMHRGLEEAFAHEGATIDAPKKPPFRLGNHGVGFGGGFLALAAVLLVGLIAIWQWLQKDEFHKELIQTRSLVTRLEDEQVTLQARLDKLDKQVAQRQDPLVNLSVIRLQPMRSASSSNRLPSYEVVLNDQDRFIVFSLQWQGGAVESFEVQLINQEKILIWSEKDLAVDVHGQVVFALPIEMISHGDFQIKLIDHPNETKAFLAAVFEFSAVSE